jgi:hypothetical protein
VYSAWELRKKREKKILLPRSMRLIAASTYFDLEPLAAAVRNRYTVVLLNCAPGFRTVDGNFGWFGESGKCCVSRQNPDRWAYVTPPFPLAVPSRKFPV